MLDNVEHAEVMMVHKGVMQDVERVENAMLAEMYGSSSLRSISFTRPSDESYFSSIAPTYCMGTQACREVVASDGQWNSIPPPDPRPHITLVLQFLQDILSIHLPTLSRGKAGQPEGEHHKSLLSLSIALVMLGARGFLTGAETKALWRGVINRNETLALLGGINLPALIGVLPGVAATLGGGSF